MVGSDLSYLLCVLNSPLSEWFFSKVGTTTGVGTVRWKKYTIQELLIPFVNVKLRQLFQQIVEKYVIGNITSEQLSKYSNKILYEVVGLIDEEIEFVEDFSKPKIIYPNMTKYMPFVYDEANFLTNQKCFIITGQNMAYLNAFLNSSLFKYCFRDSFPELQGGTRELSKIFFDKIPVKLVSLEQNEIFRKIVNSVQSDYTIEQTKYIDTLLFDLYNLTTEERKVIGYVEIK